MSLVVGVNSWSMQSTYMRPRSHRELYREALREAQLAESLGFESFWMGEHHFAYDGYSPSLMVAASRLLAGTSTLKVGSGIMLLRGDASLQNIVRRNRPTIVMLICALACSDHSALQRAEL